ncbi:MAG: alkaline shock response membrane anchor protein AmaP, partial [Candidatus Firestonebacteria bacterium]
VFLFVYQELTVRIITQTISILLLLLCLGVFFAALKLRRRDKTYKLESPYGEIKVSVGAIEDYIKMIKTEIAGVKDLSPKVFLRKGKVKIYVRMSLYADSEIGDVVVSVQSAIKSYLSNILLEEKIGAIRVFVSNIIYRDKTVEEHRRRRN